MKFRVKYLLTVALLALTVVLLVYGEGAGSSRGKLVYAESLNEAPAAVNGKPLTLRRLAFYVAWEESQVQEQALIYDPEDTAKYWNVQVKGTFIRAEARNTVIEMAVHDEVFAQLAEADGIGLSEEEKRLVSGEEESFWQDLLEDEKAERLGISYGDLCESMEREALAEKYQAIYEQLHYADEGDYDYDEEAYLELLGEQDYEFDKDLWRRVDIGNVTLAHEE